MKRALLAGPWVVLGLWLLWFAADVVALRTWQDPATIAGRVDAVDAVEDIHHPIELPATAPEAEARFFVFGSSSVAAPSWRAFNEPLSEHLGRAGLAVQFDNLGWDGLTSWHVRDRIEETFEIADAQGIRPDFVVLYYGHNDVTYTFHHALNKPGFDAVLGIPWVLTGEVFREHDAGHTFFFYKHRRFPMLASALQELGVVTLPPENFAPLLPRTLRVFERTTAEIVDFLAARQVPLVLVTTVGQLAMRPAGPLESTEALYRQAMAADSYAERMTLLKSARDAEVWTPDMRAKGPMLEMLRGLSDPPNIYVCDVEAAFLEAELPFDETMFDDPVHFTEHGQDLLTAELTKCLVAGPLAPVTEERPGG